MSVTLVSVLHQDYITVLQLSAIEYSIFFPYMHFGDTVKFHLNLSYRSECKFCNKVTELCLSFKTAVTQALGF